MMADLLDLDTLVAVKKAAPKVTPVPFDLAKQIVIAMAEYGARTVAHSDQFGQIYWQWAVKELTEERWQLCVVVCCAARGIVSATSYRFVADRRDPGDPGKVVGR